MKRMTKTLRAMLIAATLGTTACGAASVAAPSDPVVVACVSTPAAANCVAGNYTLIQINDRPLPGFVVPNREEWTASTLVLKSDLTLTGTIAWREYRGGTVVDQGTDTFTGTYSTTGTTLVLKIADDPATPATIDSDGILAFNSEGVKLAYRRQ